tara:strand:- start:91 stop:282 length:192 start_codon:yes stop_codon:yes gene_type:complete
MKDTDESIYNKIDGLNEVLAKRRATLEQMLKDKVKYQLMQGTKDDIYRIQREIKELRNSLSTS